MQFELLNEWDDVLDEFPDEKKDVYFYKKYIRLYEDNDHRPFCAVCRDKDNIMLLPFIRGKIDNYYDFETAYGYGGPISNSEDMEWNHKAFSGIYDFLSGIDYLCGFIRFHPLLNNEKMVIDESENRSIQVIYDRQTVAIDTSQNIEDIWNKQISSKNRNMIRKAEKNQLIYKAEYDFASIDEFAKLYADTMMRLDADSFYFFDERYFSDFINNMSENAFLGTIRKDGKLICAALFMYSEYYGHYHLEGSDKTYSNLGANNLLLWKAACELHNLGIKEFHLGGGTTSSQEDSLFKFKKVFSDSLKDFYIGKEIFNVFAYTDICNKWKRQNANKDKTYGNRLLKYRY